MSLIIVETLVIPMQLIFSNPIISYTYFSCTPGFWMILIGRTYQSSTVHVLQTLVCLGSVEITHLQSFWLWPSRKLKVNHLGMEKKNKKNPSSKIKLIVNTAWLWHNLQSKVHWQPSQQCGLCNKKFMAKSECFLSTGYDLRPIKQFINV